MKRSIKRQMTIMFMGLTASILIILLFLNINFLEPFYVEIKGYEFVKVYEKLEEAFSNNALNDEETLVELQEYAEMTNISFLVSDANDNWILTNFRDVDPMQGQLLRHMMEGPPGGREILEETEKYLIFQSEDPKSENEYITMCGSLTSGEIFLMRSPLESIQESVAISNQFLMMVGTIVLLLGIALVWLFTKKLTDPILELTVLSNKMANLDFEAKYTSGGTNEIGELGVNFNRMSDKLEHTISELKKANNSLQKDIERKERLDAMKNELLGNVSHELKTPIALIQGYAEGLKEGVNDDNESREFYCDVIMDEAQKMNHMVRNLLALNQLEFGDEEIDYERVSLTEIIQGLLQSMEILIQQKEAKIIFEQKESVYVWAEAYRVEQVLSNYLSNAFNHLDGENTIEIKIAILEGKARVSVFNTGMPISETDLPHIWEKFYKVDKAHTREYGGNGIGLSIVKAIMESFRQKYGANNYDNGVEFWAEFDVQ